MSLVHVNDYNPSTSVLLGTGVDEDCKEKPEEDTSLLLIVESSEEKTDGTIEEDTSFIRDDENSRNKLDTSTEEPFCLFVEEESSSEEPDATTEEDSAAKQDDVEESSEKKELSPVPLENLQHFPLSLPTTSNASFSTLTCTELMDGDSSNSSMMLNNSTSFQNSPLPADSFVKHSDNEYVVSDSDSDVICVEKKTEIIELSDDEIPECVELLTDLNVPESVIGSLKMASNKISLKLGEQIKNGGPVDNILVEVPTVIWELPWKIVSGLFKNPSINKPTKQPGKMKKPLNHPVEPKRKMAKELSNNHVKKIPKLDLPAAQIKKEDDNRIVSCFPDPNKPPEFLEVSRSGRLIKKPKRLKDDFTLYKKSKRRRNAENTEVSSPTNIELNRTIIETQSDFFNSSENSIDSESCDRWMLGSNSDSDYEVDILSTSSASSETVKTPKYPSAEEVKNLLKKERLLHQDHITLLSNHNANERERRSQLRALFTSLSEVLFIANPDLQTDAFKMSKIYILEKAVNIIKNLEKRVDVCKKIVVALKRENSELSINCKRKNKGRKNAR